MPARPKLASIPFVPTLLHRLTMASRPHDASTAVGFPTLPGTAIAPPSPTGTLQSLIAPLTARTGRLTGNPSAITSTTPGDAPIMAVPTSTSVPSATPSTTVPLSAMPSAANT
ncbi:hypothetical protein OPQ81_000541 [Rhizoctonia solani]|nr:hypothetical protein OPQ81_000541 [Rhizoctonia solani]